MSNLLRNEGHTVLPQISAFIPSIKFAKTPPSRREQPEVLFVDIDQQLVDEWKGIVWHDIRRRLMMLDTIIQPFVGRRLVESMKLAEPTQLVHPAHIYSLLLRQPRGGRHMSGGLPGLLLAKRRFGNMFVWRVYNGIPMAIRLRFYDIMRSDVGVDEMGYSWSGWVIDEISTDSPDFAQRGGRLGYYDLR